MKETCFSKKKKKKKEKRKKLQLKEEIYVCKSSIDE